MKMDATIRFQEEYLPTKRHRIPRIREVEETVSVELREIQKSQAPVAMVVTDYKSYLDDYGKDQFGLRDTSYLAFENQLYVEKRDMSGALDEGPYSMKDFFQSLSRAGNCYFSWRGKSRDDMLSSLHEFIDSHLLIDGVIYEAKNEPRYVVQTFGLGHNHGGTAMFITERYNENLSKDCYFSALDRDKAIAYANEVATARGDTDDIGTFDKDINIKVFMPEMVRCNPQAEHGEGNSFLNSMEAIAQTSNSVLESGLLAMAATVSEVQGDKKSSLSEQIQSAENKVNSSISKHKESEYDR